MRVHTLTIRTLALLAMLGASPLISRADTIWNKPAAKGAKPFERANLTIKGVKDADLVFVVNANGRQDTKPLADIFQIKIDKEPVFSGAEAAFAAEDFAKAATEYSKVMESSKAEHWMKSRSATRLIEAGTQSKNFPAVVRGYAEMLKIDPAQAATLKPTIPAATKGSLDAAVREAEKAATASGVSAEQRSTLLAFELELARANGDDATVKRVAEMLTPTGPTPSGTSGTTPMVAGGANQRIQLALVALSSKQYAQALKLINDPPDVFVNPEEQVEALYCLAEAKAGLANNNAEALKEAGIDYIRVIARAKATSLSSPRIIEALYKTAVIHEQIKAYDEAVILYQQVVAEGETTELGQKAKAAITRLSKKEPS